MAGKPPLVSLSSSLQPSMNTGFLPIRAPVTIDDDDSSDFQSDGYITYDSDDSNATSVGNGLVSGEDFETASDGPIGGDPDEENRKDSDFIGKYRLSVPVAVPVVADPSVESVENSVSGEEESDVADDYSPAVELGTPNSEPIRPIALLSVEDDDFDELAGDVSEVEDDSVPRGDVLDLEVDGKVELLVGGDSSVAYKSELLVVSQDEGSVSGEGSGVDIPGLEDEFMGKLSDNYSVPVELVQDDGPPEGSVSGEVSGVGLSGLEDEFMGKVSDNYSVPVELVHDDGPPEGSVSGEGSGVGISGLEDEFMGKVSDNYSVPVELVQDDGRPEGSVSGEGSGVGISGLEDEFMGKVSDNYSVPVELVQDDGAPEGSVSGEGSGVGISGLEDEFMGKVSDNYSVPVELVQDDGPPEGSGVGISGFEDEFMGKVSDNYSVPVELVQDDGPPEGSVSGEGSGVGISGLEDEFMGKVSVELVQDDGHPEYLVGGEEVDGDSPKLGSDVKLFDADTLGETSMGHGLVNHVFEQVESGDGGKFEGKEGAEIVVELGSTAPEDTSVANVVPSDEIQAIGSLDDGNLPRKFEDDLLENGRESNSSSGSIRDDSSGDSEKMEEKKCLLSDEEIEDLIFGGSGTTEHMMKESDEVLSPHKWSDVSNDQPDGKVIMELDDEVKATGGEKDERLFDSDVLAALLKAVTSAESNGGGAFPLELGAGSNHTLLTMTSDSSMCEAEDVVKDNLSKEERDLLEKMQNIRVKFLRLVHRLGHSPEYPMVSQVLHRLVLPTKGIVSQEFSLGTAKRVAIQLEREGKDDLDASLNILVLGKTGVGKSATINSIFGEEKVATNAYEPGTTRVKEIVESVYGVRIRILDTPGLKSTVKEEATNLKILASVKKIMKKFPPDIVLYVDRLDIHARDSGDLPLLSLLTKALTTSIWKNAIITLTHAASPLPDGPSGSPLSFEMYVAQRSHVVQQAISHAVGDLRLLHPSMRHPVSLVENHPSNLKNENKEIVLPGGESWRPQLLLLCFSLKILSEASCLSKPEASSGQKKLFGLRLNRLPIPHLVSSLLQSRRHPKLPTDQAGDEIDQDIGLMDLSDANEEEDDYDQLPPFKPLRKSQVDKLSKEQRKAYFEEYDYRVKLFQKKQLREQVKHLKEIKKRGKDGRNDPCYNEEAVSQDDEDPATMPVIMPDFTLPLTFDSDNPAHRYRILEPTSDLLVRPVLDSQVWDHDCGYGGLSIERNVAVVGQFPGEFAIQIRKDKEDFNIHLDSSVSAKHGVNGSTMVGFDIQTVGSQLAYILRGETEFKNFKMNKTSTGLMITVLGENIATGLKIEDQITVAKRVAVVASAGAVMSRDEDAAYGANFEVRLRSKDFPLEQQDQSTLSFSLLNWKGDTGMMATLQSQFSIGRNSKMSFRVGMNNRRSGEITIKTSSSELQIALVSAIPVAMSIFRRIYFGRETKTW